MLNRWYSFECFAKLFKFSISHFLSHTICELKNFIHTTMTTVTLCVCWVVFLRTTILAVLMLSIFLRAHTWNGNKMVDISTYFDIRNETLLSGDYLDATVTVEQEKNRPVEFRVSELRMGWLWYSLFAVEQPWILFEFQAANENVLYLLKLIDSHIFMNRWLLRSRYKLYDSLWRWVPPPHFMGRIQIAVTFQNK